MVLLKLNLSSMQTMRLWSWRDQFGSESHWAVRLGEHVAAAGADELWPMVTAP